MARKDGKKKRGKSKRKATPSSSSPTSVPPPPPTEPQQEAAVAAGPSITDLGEDILRKVLLRLSLADLLRAALTCQRLRRLATCCRPRDPPLLGYFHHPEKPRAPLLINERERDRLDPVFAPLGGMASSPRLSLDFAPDTSRFALHDCYQGLLLLEPAPAVPLPKGILRRLLVLDPVTRRRALLPQPPRDTVPDDRRWRGSRHYVGSALLSRAHPSRLCFEVVCFAIDDGRPRAWVASYDDGECRWRALDRAEDVEVNFDPWWFEGRCVHAAGNIYWHICNSGRLLALDPTTLKFSYLLAPDELGNHFCKYRIGERPEDGRLCIVTVERGCMQLWVRGETSWSDNGWFVERETDLSEVYDALPALPRDKMLRMASVMVSDIDAGRTGKLFITTLGYGRYSLDLETVKMELLVTKGGKEYGHPMYAYFLAWPPAFLA